MLDRARQLALFRGAEQASAIAAEEALAPLDPLLRWQARRCVQRLLRRAELETSLSELGHRYRLAYLLGAGRDVPNPDDASEVAALARAVSPPGSVGSRGPWLSALLAVLCLAIVAGGLVLRRALEPFSPKRTAAGKLLGSELTSYVVAVSRGDRDATAQARDRLLAGSRKALEGASARALGPVLESVQALRAAAPDSAEQQIHAYQSAIAGFDRALAADGHPYFLDGELRSLGGRLEPLPMSYYVQTESRVAGGTSSIRVLRLWRLDDLSVAQGLLGFTRPHAPAAIVLLDQVESDLVQFTLPGAAIGGRVELLDEATRQKGERWTLELEDRAGDFAHAHYRGLGPPLSEQAIRIGTLLSRRRELVRKWQAMLRGQGRELRVPKRLFPPVDYAEELSLRVPRVELEEWDGIQSELERKLPSFEALRDRFVGGVERHEVQHRLDYARGLIPVPGLLCRLLHIENPLDAAPGSLAARARDESSAYLAELARPEGAPIVELLILSHFVLNRDLGRNAYTYAALAVYIALARALAIDLEGMPESGITRERFARLALALWARSAAELQSAARRAYESEFGVPLPEVRIETVKTNPPYRPDNEH